MGTISCSQKRSAEEKCLGVVVQWKALLPHNSRAAGSINPELNLLLCWILQFFSPPESTWCLRVIWFPPMSQKHAGRSIG